MHQCRVARVVQVLLQGSALFKVTLYAPRPIELPIGSHEQTFTHAPQGQRFLSGSTL